MASSAVESEQGRVMWVDLASMRVASAWSSRPSSPSNNSWYGDGGPLARLHLAASSPSFTSAGHSAAADGGHSRRHLRVTYAWTVDAADEWVRTHVPAAMDGGQGTVPGGLLPDIVLGFDLEWKPSYVAGADKQNKVAVLQLAADGGHVLLLHIRSKLTSSRASPPTSMLDLRQGDLARLLSTRGLAAKVGVGVALDANRLRHDNSAAVHDTIDLVALSQAWYRLVLEDRLGKVAYDRFLQFQSVLTRPQTLDHICSVDEDVPFVHFVDIADGECSCGDSNESSSLDVDAVVEYFGLLDRLQISPRSVEDALQSASRHEKMRRKEAGISTAADTTSNGPAPANAVSSKISVEKKFVHRRRVALPKYPQHSKNSLDVLAKRFLHIDLPKCRMVSMSDWEVRPLTEKQIAYAATDAWASHQIYLRIVEEMRHRLQLRNLDDETVERTVNAAILNARRGCSAQ